MKDRTPSYQGQLARELLPLLHEAQLLVALAKWHELLDVIEEMRVLLDEYLQYVPE